MNKGEGEMHIAVVSLWAEDVPRTVHFYRDVIGLKLMPHHGAQPAFEVNGVYLTCHPAYTGWIETMNQC